MLIEKALAKVYGSYKNLDGGRPSHGFQDLVGYPIRYINCRNERFQMILDIALKAQVPVVTFGLVHNTGKFPDDATRIRPFVRKRMLAMYSRHSYSVLSMFEHENKTYVKLRNPHGRNIMWRRFEKSAILTADERESGEFCLEISQFRRWFTEYVFFLFLSLCRFFFSNTSTGVLMHGYLQMHRFNIRVRFKFIFHICRMFTIRSHRSRMSRKTCPASRPAPILFWMSQFTSPANNSRNVAQIDPTELIRILK